MTKLPRVNDMAMYSQPPLSETKPRKRRITPRTLGPRAYAEKTVSQVITVNTRDTLVELRELIINATGKPISRAEILSRALKLYAGYVKHRGYKEL